MLNRMNNGCGGGLFRREKTTFSTTSIPSRAEFQECGALLITTTIVVRGGGCCCIVAYFLLRLEPLPRHLVLRDMRWFVACRYRGSLCRPLGRRRHNGLCGEEGHRRPDRSGRRRRRRGHGCRKSDAAVVR